MVLIGWVCIDNFDVRFFFYFSQHFFEYCGKSSWLREESFDISSQATIDLRPVQEFVYIQAWQLLSLCTALFAPKHKFLLFLKGHLNRSSTAR